MPLWFIDMPSDTEMVVNGTGIPPPAATPIRAASAAARATSSRACLALRADNPDPRLVEIIVVKAAGSQEGAMRRAVETFDDNARAVVAFCAHGW
jgi:hypothetical protein